MSAMLVMFGKLVMFVMLVACSAGQLLVFDMADWAVLGTEY